MYKRGGRAEKFEGRSNGKKDAEKLPKTGWKILLTLCAWEKLFYGETREITVSKRESKTSQHCFSISQRLNILQCGHLEYKYIYKIVYNDKEI